MTRTNCPTYDIASENAAKIAVYKRINSEPDCLAHVHQGGLEQLILVSGYDLEREMKRPPRQRRADPHLATRWVDYEDPNAAIPPDMDLWCWNCYGFSLTAESDD
ncbi:MAG: hypothetical protein CMF76_10205 [Maricaulis sp.]|nr:hypothetical protein [Maricaulis sp.]